MALLVAGTIQDAGATNTPFAFTRADDVLERVRANLPNEAIRIRGELLCGARRGKLDRAFLSGR